MAPASILQSLAERANLLFFAYDLDNSHFTYVNGAFISFCDLKAGDMVVNRLPNMVHPEDIAYVALKYKALLSGKLIHDVECRFVKGDNERWLRINPFLFNDEQGAAMVMGYAEDITVYKQYTQNLNDHNLKKNSILTIMAHDLAGPIGTIQNLTELLRRENQDINNKKADRYIGMIDKISKSSVQLIRDFLDKEFLESAGIHLLKTRIELVGRIKNLIQEYTAMPKDLQVDFYCTANKMAIYVDIDEDKFLQAINNLISNALKFTSDGGSVTITITENNQGVLLIITDTGIGIPQKHHSELFDKFSDARRNGLRGELSTGLGMSIIKTIIEWHDGKIWFDSEEGNGTSFYIQLPK